MGAARGSDCYLFSPAQYAATRRSPNQVRVSNVAVCFLVVFPHLNPCECRRDDDELLRMCIAPLLKLSKHPNPEIAELSTSLRVTIMSRFQTEESLKSSASSVPNDGDNGTATVKKMMKEAMDLIMDPLLAVQAGGVTHLTSLIKLKLPGNV